MFCFWQRNHALGLPRIGLASPIASVARIVRFMSGQGRGATRAREVLERKRAEHKPSFLGLATEVG